MLESQIQSQIISYLDLKNIHHIRIPLGGVPFTAGKKIKFKKNPMAGFPDIFGWQKTGRLWALEIKASRGRLSEKQKLCIEFLQSVGSLVNVAYSFDDAKAWIDKHADMFYKAPGIWP